VRAMASRQAAVLARRGASRIALSSRAGWRCISSSAGCLLEAAIKIEIPCAERGFATVAFMRRSALTEGPFMRSTSQLLFDSLPDMSSDCTHRFIFLWTLDFQCYSDNSCCLYFYPLCLT
jgi:hypothetical protein